MDEPKPPEPQKPLPNRTQYMADMDNFVPPVKPKHLLKLVAKVLVTLVVLAALAAGGYWFATHHKTTKTNDSPAKTAQPGTDAAVTTITSSTKHYASSNYNLGFDYPDDWTISDTAGSKLTATSPALQLKGVGGQAFTGQIVLTIQNQQATISQFAGNKAVAALTSQKIAYKTPTPNQRAQTYLTFVSYTGSTTDLDALYITGDNGYQAGQSVPMSDIAQDDPLVSLSFLKCPDTTCKAAAAATAIPAASWSDGGLSEPLLTMLKSLVIN